MSLKKLFVWLSLPLALAAHASAFADTISLVSGHNKNIEILEGQAFQSDTLNFTLSQQSTVDFLFETFANSAAYSLPNFSLALYSTGNVTPLFSVTNQTSYSQSNLLLSTGSYYFQISGTPTGNKGGKYDYKFITAAAVTSVPEPAPSALLVAGLTMLGFCMRKRNA